MSKVKFTTTLKEQIVEKIKIQAIKEKRSVSEILEQLISDYLDTLSGDPDDN